MIPMVALLKDPERSLLKFSSVLHMALECLWLQHLRLSGFRAQA